MAFAAGCSRSRAPPSSLDSPYSTRRQTRSRRCVAQRATQPPPAAAAASGGGSSGEQVVLPRRGSLLAALQAATLLLARPASAGQDDILTVGAGKQFATIGAALEQAGSGATVVVSGGRWAKLCALLLLVLMPYHAC